MSPRGRGHGVPQGATRGGPAGHIHTNAVFPNIDPARVDEFNALAAELLEITKGDPGALQYDCYMSDDNTRCALRETYADSDALLAHLPLVNDHLTKIREISGGIDGDILATLPRSSRR